MELLQKLRYGRTVPHYGKQGLSSWFKLLTYDQTLTACLQELGSYFESRQEAEEKNTKIQIINSNLITDFTTDR